MKATIDKPLIFNAAANLANGGYGFSILQIERHDKTLTICGTNSYVAVMAEVDATFSRWPDGEKILFEGNDVQAIMRGIGKAIKKADSLTIEIAKGFACFTLDVAGAEVLARIAFDKQAGVRPIKELHKVIPTGDGGEDGEGEPKLASYMMTLATNAMRTISSNKNTSWQMKNNGKFRALEYISETEPARVLVMPVKG